MSMGMPCFTCPITTSPIITSPRPTRRWAYASLATISCRQPPTDAAFLTHRNICHASCTLRVDDSAVATIDTWRHSLSKADDYHYIAASPHWFSARHCSHVRLNIARRKAASLLMMRMPHLSHCYIIYGARDAHFYHFF